jgi:hypothetical protein
MQVINIFGHEFTTIASLKAFAAEHNIVPVGNKSLKITWVEAIETYMEVQSEVIATAVEAVKDAEIVAADAAEKVESAVVTAVVAVVTVLTSDAAIAVYRWVLKAVLLAIVFTVMMASKGAKWCWDNRHRAIKTTAVYHWVNDALDSRKVREILTHGLIAEWVVSQWIGFVACKCEVTKRLNCQHFGNLEVPQCLKSPPVVPRMSRIGSSSHSSMVMMNRR